MIHTIIFDWKRTLYNPDTKTLIEGTLELLNFLQTENIPLVLIGKGGDDMHTAVEKLGVKKYFSEVLFVQEKNDPELFAKHVLAYNSDHTFVIGDRVKSEVELGNKIGATTIWVKQGKFAAEEPENELQTPHHTVGNLSEVLEYLKKISKNFSYNFIILEIQEFLLNF